MQGTIRDNLDPMQQFSDRDMIRVLKDVGLWEILCGISLSHSKDEESPRAAASAGLDTGLLFHASELATSSTQKTTQKNTDASTVHFVKAGLQHNQPILTRCFCKAERWVTLHCANDVQYIAATPPESPVSKSITMPLRARPASSLPATSREPWASPRDWTPSPGSLTKKPPIHSPRHSSPRRRELGFTASPRTPSGVSLSRHSSLY